MKKGLLIVLCLIALLSGALLCVIRSAMLRPEAPPPREASPGLESAAPPPEIVQEAWDGNPQEPPEEIQAQEPAASPSAATGGAKKTPQVSRPRPPAKKQPDLSGYRVQARSADRRQLLPKDRSVPARDLKGQVGSRKGSAYDGARFQPYDEGLQLRIDISK